MITDPHHLALIKLFQDHQNILENNSWVAHYLGTNKTLYQLTTGDKKALIKNYLKPLNLSFADLNKLILSLAAGESFEEISAIGKITEMYPQLRSQLPLSTVDKIFSHAQGWAEVDTNCTFSADDMLSRWPEWKKFLDKYVDNKNIDKRRASLVLLCLPVRQSSDLRFYELAFDYVDKLLMEKDVLITKAISWILRSMIKHHPELIEVYLDKNRSILPKIAVRETTRKLLTGRK